MTEAEEERLSNALAQARGAQAVLQGLLFSLLAHGHRELVTKAFDIAGDTYTTASLSTDTAISKDAVRTLQVIDHLRLTTLKD